jgi:hypothetical protein
VQYGAAKDPSAKRLQDQGNLFQKQAQAFISDAAEEDLGSFDMDVSLSGLSLSCNKSSASVGSGLGFGGNNAGRAKAKAKANAKTGKKSPSQAKSTEVAASMARTQTLPLYNSSKFALTQARSALINSRDVATNWSSNACAGVVS